MMRRWLKFGCCLVICGAVSAICNGQTLGKPAKAETRISLGAVGYYPAQPRVLLSRTVNQTVDFIDDKHLLVTFAVKELLPRVVDDPETDEDRMIKAILMEIPSGEVLAETKWRTHDANRYLWKLGKGEFLLRIRGKLSTFNPMAGLKAGKPFEDQDLMFAEGVFRNIGVTPEGDLLQVEMRDPPADERNSGNRDTKQRSKFHTVFLQQFEDKGEMKYVQRGEANFAGAANVPLLSGGLLDMMREDAQHYGFEWKQFGAMKPADLAGIESSCHPLAAFISGYEFVAMGCRGGSSLSELGAFDLGGKPLWLLALQGESNSPALRSAPRAGRFGFQRILTMLGSGMSSNTPDTVQGQEINVFQNSSGRQLARVMASPVQQAGQNFDLSPDGSKLAVAQGNAIELYALPKASPQEKKDLDHALQNAPKPSTLPIRLTTDE